MVKEKQSKSKKQFDEYNKNFGETASEIQYYRSIIVSIINLIIGIPLLIFGLIEYKNLDEDGRIYCLVLGGSFVFIAITIYLKNRFIRKVVKKNKKIAKYYGVYEQIKRR